jgi:hypothetical protein
MKKAGYEGWICRILKRSRATCIPDYVGVMSLFTAAGSTAVRIFRVEAAEATGGRGCQGRQLTGDLSLKKTGSKSSHKLILIDELGNRYHKCSWFVC